MMQGYTLHKLIFQLLCVAFLVGCSTSKKVEYVGLNDADVTVGIPQRQAVTDRRTYELEKLLNDAGIHILSVGQDYRIIVPVELAFYAHSPRLRWRSYDTLNLIVDYLKQFRKVSIRVTAFSKARSRNEAAAMSYARARALADYIWSQEIDARVIYTMSRTIARSPKCCPGSNVDTSTHEHVEISFRNTLV